MVAAVDLDELTDARTSSAGLVDAAVAEFPRYPETVLGHPASECQYGHVDAVKLSELLLGQRGAEVGVASTDEREHSFADVVGQPAVAGPSSAFGRTPRCAISIVAADTIDALGGR